MECTILGKRAAVEQADVSVKRIRVGGRSTTSSRPTPSRESRDAVTPRAVSSLRSLGKRAVSWQQPDIIVKRIRVGGGESETRVAIPVPHNGSNGSAPVFDSLQDIPSLSFAHKFKVFRTYCKERQNEYAASLHLPDLHEQMAGGKHQKIRIGGDIIWSNIQEELYNVFPQCWKLQMDFVQAVFRVCLRRIYRFELDICIDRLLEDNDWSMSDLVNILLCIAPRRFGKTEGTAAAVAVLLICVPGFQHVHFPLLFEAGIEFLTKIKEFISLSPAGRRLTLLSNRKNCIEIQGPGGESDKRISKVMTANTKVFPLLPPPPLIVIIISLFGMAWLLRL